MVEELCRIGRQLELLFSLMRNGGCVLLGCVVDDEAYADTNNPLQSVAYFSNSSR